MPTCYTNAVFGTSRFCLKVSAAEISSILRMSFVHMFLNSHFANSIEDEVLHTKNTVTPTRKTSLFCKLNEETQPFIEEYLS